jgi:hypothetical protein
MQSHMMEWIAAAIALTAAESSHAWPTPLSSAFTYQGQLKLNGNPVNGTADFQLTLWDGVSGGNQVGGPLTFNNFSLSDGLFTISPDFGVNVFNGDARWLEISVRSPSGVGPFVTLSFRQPVRATPYALQTRGIFVDAANNIDLGDQTHVNGATGAISLVTIYLTHQTEVVQFGHDETLK